MDPQDAPGTLDTRATKPWGLVSLEGEVTDNQQDRACDWTLRVLSPVTSTRCWHLSLACVPRLAPHTGAAELPPCWPGQLHGAGAELTSYRSWTQICPVPSEHLPHVPQGLPTALPRAPARRSTTREESEGNCHFAVLGDTFSVNSQNCPLSLGTSAHRTLRMPSRDLSSRNTWPQASPTTEGHSRLPQVPTTAAKWLWDTASYLQA